jgi:hypothetical protein
MIGRSESQRYFSSKCRPCFLTEAKYSSGKVRVMFELLLDVMAFS